MAVHVVIPVHGRLPFTRVCLDSLRRQTVPAGTVTVVDDGSADGTAGVLAAEYPEVSVLSGDGGLWWAGAMNLGVRRVLAGAAAADHVLALNNDTALPADFLAALLEVAGRHRRALIGAPAVDWDDHERLLDGGIRIDWRTAERRRPAVGLTLSQARARLGESLPVSVLSGRGTLVPAEAFRRAGLYDARRLPQYGADWEFARRAQRAGFELLMCYRTAVFSRGAATGIRPTEQRLSWEAFLRAHVDRRSPADLHARWHFARLCAEPGSFVRYLSRDLVKVLDAGVRYQVRARRERRPSV